MPPGILYSEEPLNLTDCTEDSRQKEFVRTFAKKNRSQIVPRQED